MKDLAFYEANCTTPQTMTRRTVSVQPCPRCQQDDRVRRKLVLIDRADPARLRANWRVSCGCDGDLAVSDLKPEFVVEGSAAQFIQGLYCERCEAGYVPKEMVKPSAPIYQPTSGGWRRAYPDGRLGPLLERIADDPDAGQL